MKKLEVRYNVSPEESQTVGWLVDSERKIYFEYAADFLAKPLWLSPFKLPPNSGLIEHKDRDFSSLFGLFDDSLPDGWGLLLMDRAFRKSGINPHTLSPLERLAYLGSGTMGALTYHPSSREVSPEPGLVDLALISREVKKVWEGSIEDILPQLLRAGGSPGGARPKVLVGVKGSEIVSAENLPENFEPWMIKFASPVESPDSGIVEYVYSLLAQEAGLVVPETRLFESSEGGRYFGVKRFDRDGRKRIHIHTFGNLIHSNYRVPNCDYLDLLKACKVLTRNHQDVLALFRQIVFNVASHNRDDHVKNFSFIFDPVQEWSVSPAYDLTFCEGPGGEHSMTVCGEGKQPKRQHLLKLAGQSGIREKEAGEIIDEVITAVAQWAKLAEEYGVSSKSIRQITPFIEEDLVNLGG